MSSTRYAQRTTVPVMKTRIEIETLLAKHGCLTVGVLVRPGLAVVGFEKDNRRVGELVLPQLAKSYESGNMPPLLGSGEGRR